MGGEGSREVRYTAFLSYSHKDAAAAGRLHRRLENYRMPRRLAGTEGARGPIPDRLWPIFRDREELPAATDLSETVRAALAQSGALIILCSPAAAASLWVAEEIETFRRLHPDRPILAAVLDGDPPDCFPQALRAFGRDGTWHEPLATDLRPHRDGGRLGLLKLVAGITGVGLDALVQRDAARRIRRVMVVTAGAVAMMLVMATLAVVAVRAQREAERQRAEAERQQANAEGLVEFMLTDLRSGLRRSVGQVDVMQAVNERALAYYGGQPELSPDSLERRARVLHQLAEDEMAQGDAAAALVAANEAYRTTAAQLAASPNDSRRLFYHAQSEFWVGRVHELRENWPAAQRRYLRYQHDMDRLIAIDPNNPTYMSELAWSAADLANVQLNGLRDPLTAQYSYEKAANWFGRVVRARPHDESARLDQANAYSGLGTSYWMRGLWHPARNAYQMQFRIVDDLHRADPGNIEVIYRLAIAQRALARASVRTGDLARARGLIAEAYRSTDTLSRTDSRNAEWLFFRTLVQCDTIFGGFRQQSGPQAASFRRDIVASAAELARRNDPRAVELAPCLGALGERRHPSRHTRGG